MIRMVVNMLKNKSGTNSKHTDRRWTHDKGANEESAQNSEPWLKNDKFISNIDLDQTQKNRNLWTIFLCQNKLKLKDKTTSAQLAHYFTSKRQAYTLQSDENYLLVWSDIKGIVHLASSSAANGQPVIPHRYSGAFNRENVLLKTSFGLTCGFFIMTMYLVIHKYQWCSFSPKGKSQQ